MVHGGRAANQTKLGRLTNRPERSARARPSLNGMALFVMLRPDPSPHVRFSPPATQLALPTTLGPSPSFYADPGPGWLFGKPVPTALTARLACQR